MTLRMAADGLRFFIEHVKSLKSRTAVGEDGFEEEYKVHIAFSLFMLSESLNSVAALGRS